MLRTVRSLVGIVLLGCIAVILYQFVWPNTNHLTINESAPLIIQQLKAVQRLETAEMSVTKILEGKQDLADRIPGVQRDNIVSDFLFGESVAMEIYGTVTAGFDLSMLTTGAIVPVGSGSIDVILPSPEILHVSLNPETRVFNKQLGVLTKGDPHTETKLRNQALAIIRHAALDQDILQEATYHATEAIQSLVGDTWTIRHVIVSTPPIY